MRQTIEQTAVYGILLLMVALLFLFGLGTAEQGVRSLAGTNDSSAVAANENSVSKKQPPQAKQQEAQILGQNVSGTKPTWSRQLSADLEGKSSGVAHFIDRSSLDVGDWMHAGTKQFLQVLSSVVPQ